jgi:hypothetical protein
MPITYATISAKAVSLFKMHKENKMETTVKEHFLQAVGGLIGTKKKAGSHNISWKQTTITAFLQKATAMARPNLRSRGRPLGLLLDVEGG